MPTYYTPEEIADKLKVSRRSVYHWITSGRLNGVKVGQYWRVSEEDLISFVKGQGRRVEEQHIEGEP